MFHTIISEYDVFFPHDEYMNDYEFTEVRTASGVITLKRLRDVNGKFEPHSFFSTDPKAYLPTHGSLSN